MRRLAAVDAQTYWLSAKMPSDQVLLYGFAGVPTDLPAAVADVLARATACNELRLRVEDRGGAAYPHWVRCEVDERRVTVHELAGAGWAECLAAVTAFSDEQVDPQVAPWRLEVFPSITGVPGVAGPGTVVALQISHALADGLWASTLAAWLLGRPEPVPAIPAPPRWEAVALPRRAIAAARAHRLLTRDVTAGHVAPQADTRPVLHTNRRPDGVRLLRTLVRDRAQLGGPTVTVGVLAAIAEALAAHLRDLGDDPSTLGAEVPMARRGPRAAHNHFGNVGVGLFPDVPVGERSARIAGELAQRRRRADHPALQAQHRAFAATPAPLLRWGVAQFDPAVRSPTAIGNTVVSSVSRGRTDLRFGETPVAVSAGYAELSPMMGLTHGVHGIGSTVAVSVLAAASAIGDIDAYTDRLAAALDRSG